MSQISLTDEHLLAVIELLELGRLPQAVAAVHAVAGGELNAAKDFVDDVAQRHEQLKAEVVARLAAPPKAQSLKRQLTDLEPHELAELRRLVERNDRVGAVAKLHEFTQAGLRQAKEWADKMFANYQAERDKK
jgi:DNA-binding ferritin-like protein